MNNRISAHLVWLTACLFLASCSQNSGHEYSRSNVDERAQGDRDYSSIDLDNWNRAAPGTSLKQLAEDEASAAGAPQTVTPSRARRDNQLSIRVQLYERDENSTVDIDELFRITLKNTSDKPIRIWNLDTRNGYYQLELHLTNLRTGDTHVVSHTRITDDEYWQWYEEDIEPGQETIEIAPGGEYTYEDGWGDLQSPYWVWSGLPDPISSDRFAISAVFGVGARIAGTWPRGLDREDRLRCADRQVCGFGSKYACRVSPTRFPTHGAGNHEGRPKVD